jgi:hypothetical protein
MFRSESTNISASIGAPGVYVRQPGSRASFKPERMDVCAFVGIAPRGPSRVAELPEWWSEREGSFMPKWQSGIITTQRSTAVAVESFEEYQRLFGGFEGPGKLPYAVSSYFQQGGKRAYIVRIVHEYNNAALDAAGIAAGEISNVKLSSAGQLLFHARNEGTWGNGIRVGLGFSIRPATFEHADTNGLIISTAEPLPVGTLLQCYQPDARPVLRFVSENHADISSGERKIRVSFATPLLEPPTRVEIVEGQMQVDDGAGISETHTGLGLSAMHPDWLADQICYRSELIYPDASWDQFDIRPLAQEKLPIEPSLPAIELRQFSGGLDRYSDLTHQDFFDIHWSPANEIPGSGVQAIATNPEISSVTIPDLYCPESMPDIVAENSVVSLAGDEFAPCVPIATQVEDALVLPDINQLCLDPSIPADLQRIIELQKAFVDFADLQKSWVALLDVPPGLRPREMQAWRARFNSSYTAAYFPWLYTAADEANREQRILLNPAAVAAGVIANRERQNGVHHGPANELVPSAVALRNTFSQNDLDQLHPQGLNAYVMDVDGVRLSAARTLSRDPQLRQLNVRRLLILLKRTLYRQSQWAVFEPNDKPLWRELCHALNSYLLDLYRAGAFTGATAEQAFFVRCDEQLNTPQTLEAGQLIIEIGVAPAEPMEFIVLRINHDADGTSIREV